MVALGEDWWRPASLPAGQAHNHGLDAFHLAFSAISRGVAMSAVRHPPYYHVGKVTVATALLSPISGHITIPTT